MTLSSAALLPKDYTVDLITLDDALRSLAELDPRAESHSGVAVLGGLTMGETADELNLSPATIKRE